MKLKIQQLYQESVLAAQRSDLTLALEKANQCITRERNLQKHLSTLQSDYSEWSSIEISLQNQVNLAMQLTRNKLHQEAINIYQSIIKNEQFKTKLYKDKIMSSRFNCNIGAIYYAEGKFQKAVKFFKIALDRMTSDNKEYVKEYLEHKIKLERNIAFCYIRMGKYRDALDKFDYILGEKPLYLDAFRLLICNYAIKDITGMRLSFLKLLEFRGHLYEQSSLNYYITSSATATRQKEFYLNANKEFNDTFDTSLADSYDEDDDDLTDDHLNDHNSPIVASMQRQKSAAAFQLQSNQTSTTTIAVTTTTRNHSSENDANLLLKRAIRNDLLSIVHNQLLKQRNWCILTAAKLIAGEISNERIENGFVWCALSIKRTLCTAANSNATTDLNIITNDLSSFSFSNSNKLADELIAELQLACAELYLIKKRELKQAIIILKVFEQSLSSSANKRLWAAKCSALTNLAYIYLLQGQINFAHNYLNQVLELDHLHVGALVNKGVCFLLDGQLDQSREYFSEALLNEPNCISAIYNLALANRQVGRFQSALDLLFRLNNLITENEFCIYQIANM